jgi:hypothetical protein
MLVQHLGAGPAQTAAVLLETGQHSLVAVIEASPAKAGGVSRTGIMFLLGACSGSHESNWNDEEKSSHRDRPSYASMKMNQIRT